MSESSSDSESSCGWTIINAEGSDIETLGPEHGDEGQLHQEGREEEEEGLQQRVEPCEGEELQQRVEPCEGEGLQQRVEPCEGEGLQQREESREGEELQQRVEPCEGEGLQQREESRQVEGQQQRMEPCEVEGQQQRVEPCEVEGQQQRVEPCEGEGLHVDVEPEESSLLLAELHSGSLAESTLDNSLKDEKSGEMEAVSEAATEPKTLCSMSDHSSDIVTLELSMEPEPGASWEEPQGVLGEELYMGTSSSSQYAFSISESTPSLSVEHTAGGGSSSSEEEQEPCPALRRRRGRRVTSSLSETQEGRGSEPQEQRQDQQGEQLAPPTPVRGGGALNKCILLALVIAVSMSFGHFYGTVQTQERQRLVDKVRGNEMSECQRERDVMSQGKEVVEQMRAELVEKQAMVLSLTQIMDKISEENHRLRVRQSEQQALRSDLSERRQQSSLEKSELEIQHKHLASEKQQALSSLEREEQSLTALQGELLSLRAQVRSLEESSAEADSLLSQNRALKEQMVEERRRVEQFLNQKEALEDKARVLQEQLGREQSETERLRKELKQLKGRSAGGADPETDPETQELRVRLAELERKLSFEQQRSDLWERLYVETKQDRAKGDQQPRPKRPREGIINKVKETFDAVKNSTKDFVHHHKEQIKKAKEAVKENLRKFSDSVKSTFRHFKDSASRVFARRPRDRKFQEKSHAKSTRHEHQQEHARESRQERDSDRSSGQPRSHKPLHEKPHKPAARTSQGEQSTRKTGPTARKDSNRHRKTLKGCSGVFDCAYQESMTLFNKALEPIRADEFNQLIRSYVQQEVDHFHHWRELESFINGFFHNGVFIHDQMLFSDFVRGVEDYLEDMDEYQQYSNDVFEDLDDYVYKHFFGENYLKQHGPSRVIAKSASVRKRHGPSRPQWQHHRLFHPHRERKWSKPGRCTGRHMGRPTGRHLADVKIEFGPLPLDPKY